MRRSKLEKQKIEEKILSFCSIEPKRPSEISEHIKMNQHTLRASYLYRLLREGKLIRTMKVRCDSRYKSK